MSLRSKDSRCAEAESQLTRLEVWQFAKGNGGFIFDDSVGDPDNNLVFAGGEEEVGLTEPSKVSKTILRALRYGTSLLVTLHRGCVNGGLV